MSNGATKERILDAAEGIMLAKSFHSVGLNEILSAVKVPKGSFYHYFASKEQFGAELIRHYVRAHTAKIEKFLADRELKALDRFSAYWSYLIGRMTECGCSGGACLVSKLSSEVSTFSEPMREALAEGLGAWRHLFENIVREGQQDRSIRKDVKPALAAAIIQDTWQGAIQRMHVEKSVAPLRTAAQFLRAWLAPA
jgi:TetR/AcrR family transcriptional regulator, transcriptional repressor for nem operon